MALHVIQRALLAFVLASGPLCAQETKAGAQGPTISSDNPVFDFGRKAQWSTLRHKFVLKNSGGGVLTIANLASSCGCVAATPVKRDLAAGETTEVDVSFETRQFEGRVTKYVDVSSNDAATPSYRLTIQGDVLPPFYALESPVNLGTVTRGDAIHKEVDVLAAGDFELRETGIEASTPILKVALAAGTRTAEGRTYRIILDMPKDVPAGPIRESVAFQTSHPQVPRFALQVQGRVLGSILLDPRTFSFGRVPLGTEAAKTVVAKTRSGETFRILGVKSSLDCVTAEAKEVEPGKTYEIAIRLTKTAPAGNHRGSVLVTTDSSDQKELQVYYYAFVVEKAS